MRISTYLREALSAKIPGDPTRYLAFVESCPSEQTGGHKHHILPKKEFPEFAKDPSNCVCVSPGDHLRAHYWLALCAPQCSSFQVAFYLMANCRARDIALDKLSEFAEVYEKGRTEQRKHAQKLGQTWEPVNGRAAVESGHLAKIQAEGASAGGRANGPIQGLKNVESGQLKSICAAGGRAVAESGHLKNIRAAGGRTSGKQNAENGLLLRIRTPENCAKGGRARGKQSADNGFLRSISSKGGRASNHTRWHTNRGIVNPNCSLCGAC